MAACEAGGMRAVEEAGPESDMACAVAASVVVVVVAVAVVAAGAGRWAYTDMSVCQAATMTPR